MNCCRRGSRSRLLKSKSWRDWRLPRHQSRAGCLASFGGCRACRSSARSRGSDDGSQTCSMPGNVGRGVGDASRRGRIAHGFSKAHRLPSSSLGTCARATGEGHSVLIALVGSRTDARMEVFSHPGVATPSEYQPTFRCNLKVEGSLARVESALPPRPGYPSAICSNDNCYRRPRLGDPGATEFIGARWWLRQQSYEHRNKEQASFHGRFLHDAFCLVGPCVSPHV